MTQHEILKKHTEKYRTLRVINQSVIEQIEKSVGEAAEEYAKQESIAFDNWKRNHSWVMDRMESRNHTNEEYWHEYQQSKIK